MGMLMGYRLILSSAQLDRQNSAYFLCCRIF